MVILQLEEQPPLIQAVFAGEIEQARNLLEHKEDVNCQDYEKRSALHAAAFRGDAGMAKLLIDHGARVNTKDSKWLTPLHRACSSGSEETVSVLLDHSADTSARDRQWQTPLHIAAAHNALECVSSLLDKVPNPNVTDRSGRTALHHAVLNGHNDIVELLISKGCVVNACDKKDCRPMHWAAHMGHVDTIELLLRNGADINARDRNLYTPLHVAAASGMVSACRILLTYGANVDSQNAYGNTPLHIACLNGHVPVCQELVSNGCDKEALNYRGQTPLHIAAASTHGVHCLNYLVSLRVNINKQSVDGRTPLHMTAIHGRFTRSKTLIDRGAIVDCVDKNGCTALHIAAQHGHELLSNTLLSYGADASKRGHEGRTALHMCCLSGYVECCRTFIKAGVDINAQDDSGKTPTHCASNKGSVECLDLLVSSGADFKASDNIGRTALHYAGVQGYFDCVFTLVGIGSNVNQADNEECTALHLAAAYDLEGRCVDYLIQHKADSRLKDKNGFTPIHYAVAGNNLCGLRYLLDSCGSAYLLFGHDMPSTTPMHIAAKNGNMEILEKLMPYFPDPNIKTEHGCTPLLLAAREGFANCVQLLLRFGAKVSICDSVYNMSAVHHSAKNGHVHCLALLVDNAEDKGVVDLPDKLQRTALMLAVSNSHSDCVLTLIKSGANPNIVDSDFHSCLFRSVVTGQHNILQMLLPRSSTINKSDVNGKTVLHIAAACGRVTCLQRILHYMDRNVAASQDNQKFTALHWACYSGSSECVEHLLKEGIFKQLEGNPFSAVHCATAAGSEKCLTLLCAYFGADIVRLRDERNRTPLHVAALHGRMECALYLLQQGAEIECQDEDGRTPLIAAAQNGQVQVIEVLIGYKADMTSFDKNGNTALHLACLQKHNHAALLLLEYTDDPRIINMANNDRKTPLHLSARNGLVDVTRQLIFKGSSVIAVDSNGLTPALCCAPNPSVAQCLAIILASYPGLTSNNKKVLMNPKLFKPDDPKTSTNSQTEISLVKNPDQFELEQMFDVKFQPDYTDLKYSKEELLCLTSSIVQNFFEGKHSKKQRRKIISDTSCFIVENYDGNDDSFAEKPAACFGRDLHKSQSDMTLTTKTIYSEEDYGRIIQSARPKEGKKLVLASPQSEGKRLGGDPDRRKSLRRLQEPPKGEFIMKKFLESTAMNQTEDVKRPHRQPPRLRRKAEGYGEQNQARPRSYPLDFNNRPNASAIYHDMGAPLQVPCDEVGIEINKRSREQLKARNKSRGGAKPKQRTGEAKDFTARLRPKKSSSKVEETLNTISSYCDHILKTVKADYTTYIPFHLRNKTTEYTDLKAETFIDGSKIEKCGENPLLSDDSLKKVRHLDAELTITTTTKNIAKKQSKKKPDLKTLSFIHINPMYINEDKRRCYPTFWCFPEINKQPRDCRDLRSSSSQSASPESASLSGIQQGEENSPNSQGGGSSPRIFSRTEIEAYPSASTSNQIHRECTTAANSNYVHSPSSRVDPTYRGAWDSPNLSGTFEAAVNSKYRFPPELEKKLAVSPDASAFNVDGNSSRFAARVSPDAVVNSNSVHLKGRGAYSPSFEDGTDFETNAKISPTFKTFEVGTNSEESRISASEKSRETFVSPSVRSTFETAVNSKYKIYDSPSFGLSGDQKKLSPHRSSALKIVGNSRSKEASDSPTGRSSKVTCDSPTFEVGRNPKKFETSSNENSRSNEARDSPVANSKVCDTSSFKLGGSSKKFETSSSNKVDGESSRSNGARDSPVSNSRVCDSSSFELGGSSKKFETSPNKVDGGSSRSNGARDSPVSNSGVCDSCSFELGGSSKKLETSSDKVDGESSHSNGVRDSPASKARVCDFPYFGLGGNLSKSRLLRGRARYGFEASAAGVSPDVNTLNDSSNARNAFVKSQASDRYSTFEESNLSPGGLETNVGVSPTSKVDEARASEKKGTRDSSETGVNLDFSPSKFGRKRTGHNFETSPNANVLNSEGNTCDSPASTVCDSPHFELDGNSKRLSAGVSSDVEVDGNLVKSNRFPSDSPNAADSNSVQSSRDSGYSPSLEVCENAIVNSQEADVCNSPIKVDSNSVQLRYSPSFENANVNCLEADICDSPIAVDSNFVQSEVCAGNSPSSKVDRNSDCPEASTCDSSKVIIEQMKEGDSKLAVRHLNYDKRLKLEINKRLRRQAKEEYVQRDSPGWTKKTENLDLFQARETKTDDVTHQIENYALFLQKLASQFDCLMQGRLVVYTEADRSEEDVSPTFEDDVELIEELYNKRDDAERGPEEASRLDKEILDLGRKIILKYFTPSKRGKPLQRLLEECAKRRFDRKVLEEQLRKAADFIPPPQTTRESLRGNGKEEDLLEGEDSKPTACSQTSGVKLRENEEESRVKLRRNEEESCQTSCANLRGNEEGRIKLRKNEEESCQTRVELRRNEECCANLRGNEEGTCQTTEEEYTPKELMDMIDGLYEKRDAMLRGNEDTEALSQQISELELRIIRRSSAKHKLIDLIHDYKSAQLKDNQSNKAELRKLIKEMIVEEMEKDDTVKILYDKKDCLQDSEESFFNPRKLPLANTAKLDTLKEGSDLHVKKEGHEHVLNWKLYLAHRNLMENNINKEEKARKSIEGCIPKKQATTITAKKKKKIKPEFRAQRSQPEARKLKESDFDKRFKFEECESLVKIDELIREDDPKPRKVDLFKGLGVLKTDAQEKKGGRSIIQEDVKGKEEIPQGLRVIEADTDRKKESGRGLRLHEEDVKETEESDRRWRLIEDVTEKEESGRRWRLIEEALQLRIKDSRFGRIEESDWIEKSRRATEEEVRCVIRESEVHIEDYAQIEENGRLQIEDIEENELKTEDVEEELRQIEDAEGSEAQFEEAGALSINATNFQLEEEEVEHKIEDYLNEPQIEDIEESALQIEETEAGKLQFEEGKEDLSEVIKLQIEETLRAPISKLRIQRGGEEENKWQVEGTEECAPQIEETKTREDTGRAFEEIELQFQELGEVSRPEIEETEIKSMAMIQEEVARSAVEEIELQAEGLSEENRPQIKETEIMSVTMSQEEDTRSAVEEIELQVEGPQIEETEIQNVTLSREGGTRSAVEEIELQSEELSEEDQPTIIEDIKESETLSEDMKTQSISKLEAEATTWRANEESEDVIEEMKALSVITEDAQEIEETLSAVEELQFEETLSVVEDDEPLATRAVSEEALSIDRRQSRSVTEEKLDTEVEQPGDTPPSVTTLLRIQDSQAVSEGIEETSRKQPQGVTEEIPLAMTNLRIEEKRTVSKENANVDALTVSKLQIEETWAVAEDTHQIQRQGVTLKLPIEETRAVSLENEDTDREQPPLTVMELRVEETPTVSEENSGKQTEENVTIEEAQANEEIEGIRLRGLTEDTPSSCFTRLQIEETRALLEEETVLSVRKLQPDADAEQPQSAIEQSSTRPREDSEAIEDRLPQLQIEETRAVSEDADDEHSQDVTEESDSEEKQPKLQIEETRETRGVVAKDVEGKKLPGVIEESVTRLQSVSEESVTSSRDNEEIEEEKRPQSQFEAIPAVSEDLADKQPQGVIEECVTRLRDNEEKQPQSQFEETRAVSEDVDDKQLQDVIEEYATSSRGNEEIEEKRPQSQFEETWVASDDLADKQPQGVIEECASSSRGNEEIEEKRPQSQFEETRAVSDDLADKQPQGVIEEYVTISPDSEEKQPQPQIEETWGAVLGDAGKKQLTFAEETISPTQNKDDEESALSVKADEVSSPSCSTQPLGDIEENAITDGATQLQIEDNVLSECTDISDSGQDKSEEYHDLIDLDGIADIQNELLDNVFYDAQAKAEETADTHKQQSETPAQLEGGKSGGELKTAPKTKKSFPSLSKLGKKARKDSNCKIS